MSCNVLVAIPRPFRTLLTYSAPDKVQAGCRVSVPLGHSQTTGLVTQVLTPSANAENTFTIKPIHKIIDSSPVVEEHLLTFLNWAATYYHHAPGEVTFAALPTALRGSKQLPEPEYWQAVQQQEATELLQRAKKQQQLYHWLQQQTQAQPTEAIRQQTGTGWRSCLNALLQKGLVIKREDSPQRNKTLLPPPSTMDLTPEQENCLTQCRAWFNAETLRPVYLHGVTGSGKTEIYLRLITDILKQGRQVLVLVPEIGLTPQLLQRFQAFFPQHTIVTQHSGLNDGQRMEAWLQTRNGQAHILIGTRSAIFTPFAELGLIVIDEEHDLSFKQQEGFRYHARDLATKRAQMLGIPILMGSATPALESLLNTDLERYHYTRLARRPGKSRPPSLEVQDVRGYQLQAGLSEQSLKAIRETLNREEQVMVFINRRGFAPVLLCPACGWQAQCPSCSSNMTFHTRGSRLICHHCGTDRHADSHCPDCQTRQLTTQGQGTERIELMLKQHFTQYDVIRIDRDSTSRKGSLQQHLDRVHSNVPMILVGTQMLAKGHDFPNLTLVIALDIDQALLSAEYHALERFGQLMTQVAGRAGRSSKPGQVILQTTQPEHPVLLTLLQHGYLAFARQLLEERKRWNYPPYGYQALIRSSAPELEPALDTLATIRSILLEQLEHSGDVSLLGPVPAPMEKRAGRYRAQLLLQSKTRQIRHHCLALLIQQEKNIPNKRGVRWSIDVDPVELF
ncbi:MAG: primosomal protein N' [Thiolinea sp.]